MSKVKIHRNPARNNIQTYKPYVPAYKELGVEPTSLVSDTVRDVNVVYKTLSKNSPIVSNNNPRIKPPPTFQKNVPFANVDSNTKSSNAILNSGNNIERSWASMDDNSLNYEYIEENEVINPNHQMIDNNFDDVNNYNNIPEVLKSAPQPSSNSEDLDDEVDNSSNELDVHEDQYVIIIDNSIASIGFLDSIQEEVKLLVFGEHPTLQVDNPEDIIVLKRIKIKIGVFLE